MKNELYVLISERYEIHGFSKWDGYYTGHTYRYESEEYACTDKDLLKAKTYSSYKRAENACKSLNAKVVNYKFTVQTVVIE